MVMEWACRGITTPCILMIFKGIIMLLDELDVVNICAL